ncbi:hypothetical protein [Bacillus sp. es.034]|uniref:hypothetical protein n=1 Tax=Bacillus sp. es.034 TaxID=1761763 RepID=UPI000C00592E|nr:hypothetical protein [Bacillus sp. es.034]PFG07712.1 hypothetical protein ATG71_4618 [Bacillus sp. es.034]
MLNKLFGNRSKTVTPDLFSTPSRTFNSAGLDAVMAEAVKGLAENSLNEASLHIGFIPEKKLSTIIRIYNIEEQEILAVYDTTVLKSGKDGMMVGKHMIGLKHSFDSAQTFDFEELVTSGMDLHRNALHLNDGKILDLKRREYLPFLTKLKEYLISEDATLRMLYETRVDQALEDMRAYEEEGAITLGETVMTEVERLLIPSHDTGKTAMVYYYGCMIGMKLKDFERSYHYLSLLKELQVWKEEDVIQLEQDIDTKKVHFEFEIMDERKESLISENQFKDALQVITQQKELDVLQDEILEEEIRRVLALEQEYIRSLESVLTEKLNQQDFASAMSIIGELNEINPDGQYKEHEIRAQIGLLKFTEAEEKIVALDRTDYHLADLLRKYLESAKETLMDTILDAVKEKKYNFFTDHPELKNVKDRWGMNALMYFIVAKDLDGIRLLADTYQPDERNIIGHTAMNLVCMDLSHPVAGEAVKALDPELKKMLKTFNSKEKKSKAGGLLIKGVDSINKNVGSIGVMEITSNLEASMSNSLEEYRQEIRDYLLQLIENNHREYEEYLIHPKDYQKEYEELLTSKGNTEEEIKQTQIDQHQLEQSFDEEYVKLKQSVLPGILLEAARREMGEKDEFETTDEYNQRLKRKAIELETYVEGNAYIQSRLT